MDVTSSVTAGARGTKPRARSVNSDTPPRVWPVALAMVIPLLGALGYFGMGTVGPVAQALYAATKVFTVVWPVFVLVVLERHRGWRGLPHGISRRAVAVGLCSGAIMGALIFVASWSPLGEVLATARPQVAARAASLGVLRHYVWFAVFLSIAHSAIEEYYWRWFVFGRLRRLIDDGSGGLRRHLPSLLAAMAFAAHHVVVVSVFAGLSWGLVGGAVVMCAGLVWNSHYARQGSLVGAWVSHATVDAAIMAVGYNLLFGQ